MSTQATHTRKKREFREDGKCPKCQDGRIKIRSNSEDGSLFLGCSNFHRLNCRFKADIPERPGYVYVLSNRGYHRNGLPVVKVGYTTNTMQASLEQIDKTGVPFAFRIEHHAMVWKA
jgi:ssDNA-binding Zn-finger/Zn-ribbon topoisomerase 1